MTYRDIFITPLVIVFVLSIAWYLRPLMTNIQTRRYFFPGLFVKLVGALAVGFIYQFYYGGGDTFTYFHLGSVHIWDAFIDSPLKAMKLIFGTNEYTGDTFEYSSKIYTFLDMHSYFVVRIAGLLGILTFNTYSSIAVLFGALSFTGIWAMYIGLNSIYKDMHWPFAIAVLFIPSVFFWGSGLLKDTLTLGALGWLTYGAIHIFLLKKRIVSSVIVLVISGYILYVVKIYILLCLIPAIILWVMQNYTKSIKQLLVRIIIWPLSIIFVFVLGYYTITILGETSHRYSIDKFAYTAESTAKWNYYVSQRDGGSGYTLGDYDYSSTGLIKKFPSAVWVALYRPYLWESGNVVMLLSGLENFFILLLTLYTVYKVGIRGVISTVFNEPYVFFCLIFCVGFAFAVGVSTYNFGSLVRYKIPLIPYFITALLIIRYHKNRLRKFSPLDSIE